MLASSLGEGIQSRRRSIPVRQEWHLDCRLDIALGQKLRGWHANTIGLDGSHSGYLCRNSACFRAAWWGGRSGGFFPLALCGGLCRLWRSAAWDCGALVAWWVAGPVAAVYVERGFTRGCIRNLVSRTGQSRQRAGRSVDGGAARHVGRGVACTPVAASRHTSMAWIGAAIARHEYVTVI